MTSYSMMAMLLTGLVLVGTGMAGERRAAEVCWQGVDEFSKARVENSMSATIRRPGKAGGVGMPAIFLHPQSQGRAVLSFPPISLAQPGQRVFFIGYAGISDGFEWGQADRPADGARFYVTADGKEVIAIHVQESKWVPVAAELYHSPREGGKAELNLVLATDAGQAGNSNYDWAMFGEPVVVSVEDEPLGDGVMVSGTSGVVIVRLAGGNGRVMVEGLTERGDRVADAVEVAEVTEPTRLAFVRFDFSKYATCAQWRWRAEGVKTEAAWGGSWQPQLVIQHVGPTRAVSFAGENLRVRAAVRNAGLGTILPTDDACVQCGGQRKAIERLVPGQEAEVEFDLGPLSAAVGGIEATVMFGDKVVGSARSREIVPWPVLPELSPQRPQNAHSIDINQDYAILENRHCRWVVNKKVPGLGAVVYVWSGNRWELAGTVAPWVEIAGEGRWSAVPDFAVVGVRQVDGGAGVDAKGEWNGMEFRVQAELQDDKPALRIEVTVRARREARLRALWGPAVHAGDRGTGTGKGIAVFPGLEYLEAEERSSSERDLAPPLNKRWTPHKFKVTVPMMVIETRKGGPVLGIAWDPRQKWDSENIAPGARFASPDFLTHQDSHLMQLILPSVPDFVPENEDRAPQALVLGEGREWRLVQHVIAGQPEPDATRVFEWFDDLVGYPEAEPWPRSFEEEIALCRHGFMVTVWDEETKKSQHCVGWAPGNAPGFATLLLMDARAVAKGEEKSRVMERVKLIAEQTLKEEGPAGLVSRRNCHIMGWEFPYHGSGQEEGAQLLSQSLAGMRAEAYAALNSQEEDGGWGYYPNERTKELGEPGTRVIGICAGRAYTMAKWVAVSGDPVIEQAIRKALTHMEQYVVPRGAQGWECPILEPDILAAAYAVRAYVWAYMALGEERWLDHARYWARTGLPFQYAWDDGQRPGMRYASIPVFGSTFFTHSWIGLPVQWCGLVYAYGLQELMRFDNNTIWRKQVEGITASAVHQQWPVDNEKLAGSYPDSYGNWFTRRNPAYINPEDIAVNVLALRGLDPGLRSKRVEMDGGAVHITAPGDLTVAKEGNRLNVQVRYLPDEIVYLTVAPVKPVGGLAERPGVEGVAYNDEVKALVVGVRCGSDGVGRLELSGIERSAPEVPQPRQSWEFDEGVEGWQAANSCTVAWREGALAITVTGHDPYAVSGPAEIRADRNKRLRTRVRLTDGKELGLFWRSSKSPNWGPDKEVHLTVPADGQWHEVAFDLGGHDLWAGTILQIRLDVEPADVKPGTLLEVDWIRAE